MSVETESRRPLPELDVEQEVDFGRYWSAIVARSWLLVVGVAAGALIGYLVTLGGSTQYKAAAQVYLGEPLAPGAGGQVSSAPTALGLASNVVTGEATVRSVAARVGLKPSKLRGHISTKPILGITGAKVGTPAPLLEITVTGASPSKVAAASNALGELVADRASQYVDTKIQVLKDHLAYDARQLETIRRRLAVARQEQQEVLANKSLGAAERLISLENFNSVIVSSEGRQSALEQDQFAVRQVLKLAEEVERGRVVQEAEAVKTAGPSRGAGVLIGAVIGLIVGILAAIVWKPLTERVRLLPE